MKTLTETKKGDLILFALESVKIRGFPHFLFVAVIGRAQPDGFDWKHSLERDLE